MKRIPPFWVIGLVTIAAMIAGAYGLQILRISGHVAMPPKNATPNTVVETFIRALNEHDCNTAASLWVPSAASQGRQWCVTVEHVSASHLGVLNEPQSVNLVTVGATLNVENRLISNDNTLPTSPFGWSFILTRGPHGWRIVDNGQG